MISKRTGLFFPGTVDLEGYATIGVSENEVIIANIESLTSWFGTDDWDVPDTNNGMMDRVSDDLYLAQANTDVASSFQTNDSGFINYLVASSDDLIVQDGLDTSGDFTVVMCSEKGFGLGSSSFVDSADDNTTWYFRNGEDDYEGALQVLIGAGATSASFANYAGPTLNDTGMNLVIVEVDRGLSQVRFRVNGVSYDALETANVATNTLLNELQFGTVRARGVTTPSVREDTYIAEAMSFNSLLSTGELETIESYIMSKYSIG